MVINDKLLNFIDKLPKCKLGIINELQVIQEGLHSDGLSVVIPNNLNIDVVDILLFEIIPIEDMQNCSKGIIQLFEDFKIARYPFITNVKKIKSVLQNVGVSIFRRSHSTLGLIDMKYSNNLIRYKYIKHLFLDLHHYLESNIIISIRITPSPEFANKFKELCLKAYTDKLIVDFKDINLLKTPFLRRYTRQPKQVAKKEDFFDLFLEIKYQAIQLLKKYFQGYFMKHNTICPSIEVFLIEELKNQKKETKKRTINLFWQSFNFQKESFRNYVDKKNKYVIVFPDSFGKHEIVAHPLKIGVYKRKKTALKAKKEFVRQISTHIGGWINVLGVIWVVETIIFNFDKLFAIFQRKVFDSSKKISIQKLFYLRQHLSYELRLYERISSEFTDERLFDFLNFHDLPIFRRSIDSQDSKHSFSRDLIDHIKYLISKLNTRESGDGA